MRSALDVDSHDSRESGFRGHDTDVFSHLHFEQLTRLAVKV